jgi:hypothetical protein
MPRFRKRPVEVEARQLTRENGREVWEWVDGKAFYEPDGTISGLTIFTLEGRMKADFDDWIIQEPFPSGGRHFYPCKPDIFTATYEAVTR